MKGSNIITRLLKRVKEENVTTVAEVRMIPLVASKIEREATGKECKCTLEGRKGKKQVLP